MAFPNKMTSFVWVALTVCNLHVAAAAKAQNVSFVARFQLQTGRVPLSVAVGDFNGDGVQDIAVANSYSNDVAVLLGNGDGSFQAARNFAAGVGSSFVAVGDFNGDGIQDLAVTNLGTYPLYQDGGVSVLLGNGDGSFQAAWSFATGSLPHSVAMGDFNRDGAQDLVVANAQSDNVSVFLGNGDGSFQAARNFAAGHFPGFVVVGDFNGDGLEDVAVNTGYVLLGNGDGSFQTERTSAGGDYLAVGDFNGDGILDLVAANPYVRFLSPGGIHVFLGNGDGTFRQSWSDVGNCSSVAVGDFNGDGVPDLVTARGSLSFDLLLGNGDGTFQPGRHFSAGSGSVAVADFNGDGALDVVITESANTVTVVSGNGNGSFQVAPKFDAGARPWSVALGDFNGDGAQDLVVANNFSNGGVSVLLGNGDGSFGALRNFPAGNLPWGVAVGDFNGDGVPDLAVANYLSNDVSVLLGIGDGTFQTARNLAIGASPQSVAVGDFNGDGVPDLAIAYGGAFPVYNGGVSVLLGIGDGNFRPALNIGLLRTTLSIAVGDFNGDGVQDLAVSYGGVSPDYTSGVAVLLGTGDGGFQAPRHFGAGESSSGVAVGDFNGDGTQDLAVSYAGMSPTFNGGVAVLLGNGDGSFQAAQRLRASSGPISVAVGDFNGDGAPDLAVANEGSHDVSVLLGNGDGSFQSARTFGTGMGPKSVAVGDFNGDGMQDLAVANAYMLITPRGSYFDWGVSALINNTPPQ